MLNLICNEKCPGCGYRRMSAQESLDQKQRWLWGKLSKWIETFDPIRPVNETLQLRYRDKVCLTAIWDESGWKFGLVHQEQLIDLHHCPVHTTRVEKTINIFIKSLPAAIHFPIRFYVQSGAQVTLVVKQKEMPDLSWLNPDFISLLRTAGIEGLWLHLNPGAGRKVFAKNVWHLLWGAPRSVDCNGFIYGPKSFQQLIPELYKDALDRAELFFSPKPDDVMIDLYCGTGTGLAQWENRKCRILGVEIDGEAVDCARKNVPSATVLRGKCKDRIPQIAQWISESLTSESSRLINVNPPRTGIETEVLEWLANSYKPDRIAYLSCSPGTLRRDLMHLEAAGYQIIKIIPYDFFPGTIHVECLALLNREM